MPSYANNNLLRMSNAINFKGQIIRISGRIKTIYIPRSNNILSMFMLGLLAHYACIVPALLLLAGVDLQAARGDILLLVTIVQGLVLNISACIRSLGMSIRGKDCFTNSGRWEWYRDRYRCWFSSGWRLRYHSNVPGNLWLPL